MESLPCLFNLWRSQTRLVSKEGHACAIVGVRGHAQSGAALHLLNRVAHGVHAAAGRQEVAFVLSLLSLDLADGLVE